MATLSEYPNAVISSCTQLIDALVKAIVKSDGTSAGLRPGSAQINWSTTSVPGEELALPKHLRVHFRSIAYTQLLDLDNEGYKTQADDSRHQANSLQLAQAYLQLQSKQAGSGDALMQLVEQFSRSKSIRLQTSTHHNQLEWEQPIIPIKEHDRILSLLLGLAGSCTAHQPSSTASTMAGCAMPPNIQENSIGLQAPPYSTVLPSPQDQPSQSHQKMQQQQQAVDFQVPTSSPDYGANWFPRQTVEHSGTTTLISVPQGPDPCSLPVSATETIQASTPEDLGFLPPGEVLGNGFSALSQTPDLTTLLYAPMLSEAQKALPLHAADALCQVSVYNLAKQSNDVSCTDKQQAPQQHSFITQHTAHGNSFMSCLAPGVLDMDADPCQWSIWDPAENQGSEHKPATRGMNVNTDDVRVSARDQNLSSHINALAMQHGSNLAATRSTKPAIMQHDVIGKVGQPPGTCASQTVAGLPLPASLTPDQEVVKLSLSALGGTLSAMKMLAQGVARCQNNRMASQQQLVERILLGAELRLRLQAFLTHFQHASKQVMVEQVLQKDSVQDSTVTTSQIIVTDSIITSFICCVRQLVTEYDAQLQLLEATCLSDTDGIKHLHSRQQTTLTDLVGNRRLTLLQLVLQVDPLLAQLQLLANVCNCLPASQLQHQKQFKRQMNSMSDINKELSKWQLSPAFNLLHVLHGHYDDGGLNLPLSGWMSHGLPQGTSLLNTLYSGLQQADSTLATVFRRLFAAAASPYLTTLWQWLYRDDSKNLQPYTALHQPQDIASSFHSFAALPGSASSLVYAHDGQQAIQQCQQGQVPSPPPFPSFLSKVQHEALLAGSQQRLLLRLEPQIGDIARRFTRIWTRELGFGSSFSGQGQTYMPDSGQLPAEPADGLPGSLANNRQDVRKVSEAVTRASDICWQELDRVTSLMAKRREAAAVAQDLAAFARQQLEEARQEALRDVKEAQAVEARSKRAALLAAQLVAADQAIAARERAKAEQIRAEQQQLLVDAVQEHSAALSVLQTELEKYSRAGMYSNKGDQNSAVVSKAKLAVSRATSEREHGSNSSDSIQALQQDLIRTEWRMKRLGLSAERQANWQSLEALDSYELSLRLQPTQATSHTNGSSDTTVLTDNKGVHSMGMPVKPIPAALNAPPGQQSGASLALDPYEPQNVSIDNIPNPFSFPIDDEEVKKQPVELDQVTGTKTDASGIAYAENQGQGMVPVNKVAMPPYNRMQRRSNSMTSRSIVDMPAAGLPSRRVSTAGLPKNVPNKTAPIPSHARSRSFSHTPGTTHDLLSRRESLGGKTAAGRRIVSRSVSNAALLATKKSKQNGNTAPGYGQTQTRPRKQWETGTEETAAGSEQQQVKPFDWYEHLYGQDWVNKETRVSTGASLPWHDAIQDDEGAAALMTTAHTRMSASQADSTGPAPVSEEVEVCVALPVMSHYWLTTHALWRVMTQELKLMDLCILLRRLFFFEAGDFALHLKDCLLDRWQPVNHLSTDGSQQPSTRWGITSRQMQAALAEAVAMCPSIAIEPQISRLSLSRATDSRDVYNSLAHSNQPGATQIGLRYGIGPGGIGDSMMLQFDMPWPMNQILCGSSTADTENNALAGINQHDVEVMGVYSDIASALMRLRVCAAALQNAWLAVGKPTALHPYIGLPHTLLGSNGNNMDHLPYAARQTVARRLAGCRGWIHEALHFLGAFQRHCAASLMGSCWKKFEARMLNEGPLDIVQMAQAHTDYVLSAAAACFLCSGTDGGRKGSLQLAVCQAINHCEVFAATTARFTDVPQQAQQTGSVTAGHNADTSSADLYPQLKAAHHNFHLAVNLVWKRLQEPVTGSSNEQSMAFARSLQAELECNWYSKRDFQNL